MAKSSRIRPEVHALILRMRSRHLIAVHVSCSCTVSLYRCNTSVCFLLIAYHVGCIKKVLLSAATGTKWQKISNYSVFYVTKLFVTDSVQQRPKRPNSRFRSNGKLLWPSGSEKGQNGEIWPEKGQTGNRDSDARISPDFTDRS